MVSLIAKNHYYNAQEPSFQDPAKTMTSNINVSPDQQYQLSTLIHILYL